MERAKELINEAIADKLDLKLLKIDTSKSLVSQVNFTYYKLILCPALALQDSERNSGRNSLAWNRESIRNKRFVNEVAEAYSAQFKNDIESFLNARAQELVAGGLMFILIVAVPDGIPLSQTTLGVFYDVFGSCLMDMAKMGITSKEKINSFNIPNHRPTPKELESIIKTNKYFTIERMEQLADRMSQSTFLAKCRTSAVRAVYEGVVMEHFGSEFVEPFFNHFTVKVEENASRFEKFQNPIDLFVLLKRTGDELN
ncbi:hypothetical protein WN943_006534 [Citrus x changshan-huyou]